LAFSLAQQSVCPAGGKHDHSQSGNYTLAHNDPSAPGQSDWRWCKKCQGLAFSLNQPSVCPAGGSHDYSQSGNYTLASAEATEPSAAFEGSVINFLHLSDLHFVADDTINAPLKERFNFIKKEYPNDVLIITGDIIDNEGNVSPGTPVPIETNVEGITAVLLSAPPPVGPVEPHLEKTKQALRNAYRTISTFSTDRVYLCPGNHDFALAGNLYDEAFLDAFDELIWKPLNSSHPVLPFGPQIGTANLTSKSKRPILYPVTSPAGFTISLIGLNTCPIDPDSTVSPLTLAAGVVGGSQLSALEQGFLPETMIPGLPQMLGLSSLTFIFFHHHPWIHPRGVDPKDTFKTIALEMVDANELMKVLRGHVDLILFGHRHVETRYQPNTGPTIQIKYGGIAAGSSRVSIKAWRISVRARDAVTFAQVPITASSPAPPSLPPTVSAATGRIDAIVYWPPHDKAYFFRASEYVRYRLSGGEGAEKKFSLADHNWTGLAFEDRIDAAATVGPEGLVYFFRGDKFVPYRISSGDDERALDEPRPIVTRYPLLPPRYQRDLDAVLYWPNGSLYFFKDAFYLACDPRDGAPLQPERALPGGWRNLPFGRIDAAFVGNKGKGYFFRGEEYVRYSVSENTAIGLAQPWKDHWPGLAAML
jgi:3',5'-cyclic AMP phosphodiesterase CpdA